MGRLVFSGGILVLLGFAAGCQSMMKETLPVTPPGQGPGIGVLERVLPPSIRNTAEFRFDLGQTYDNPYDPEQITVDALVTGPDRQTVTVPAFWCEPFSHELETQASDLSNIRMLRFFITAGDFGPKASLSFALDDIEVFNSKTGAHKTIEDFEREILWKGAKEVSLQKTQDQAYGGSSSLLVRIDTTAESTWPGLNLDLPEDDWSAYDSLRFQFRPISGLTRGSVGVEFYNKANDKFQGRAYEGSTTVMMPTWREETWMFARPPMPKAKWTAQGTGSWRLRLAVPVSGTYAIQLRARDANGEAVAAPLVTKLTQTEPDGFIRADSAGKRYFRFDSGRPYLALGTNLIASDLGTYQYYLTKFAGAGCNFTRFWMSWHSMGIEGKELTRYDQQRAAAMDGLVNLSRDLDMHLMFCLTDFREVNNAKSDGCYWKNTAYADLCTGPADFFCNETAMKAYRKRLRYVVARWSASNAVHSWEFFNEVNITNGWKDAPDDVRHWHQVMSDYLHDIDPYQHIVTSSFAQVPDDDLWALPSIDMVQKHSYPGRFVTMDDVLEEAVQTLWHREKPMIVGEFGRHYKNLWADADCKGDSLVEGLWGPVMAGAAGTGMPWWWGWVDRYGLYRHFEAFSTFAKDIRWHEEEFVPIASRDIVTQGNPDSDRPPGAIYITPVQGTWKPAPFNEPVTVTVGNDGTVEPPDLISSLIHGIGNHKDLHNPQTYKVNYPVPGRFAVNVSSVSGWGGASLKVTLDGQVVLDKAFTDPDGTEFTDARLEYNGGYGIDVPSGEHTITVENLGKDWFTITQVTLQPYGNAPLKVKAMALHGKETTLVWARTNHYVWYAPLIDLVPEPARNVTLQLPGFADGTYTAQVFELPDGKWAAPAKATARNGILQIPLGTLEKAVALQVRKTNSR